MQLHLAALILVLLTVAALGSGDDVCASKLNMKTCKKVKTCSWQTKKKKCTTTPVSGGNGNDGSCDDIKDQLSVMKDRVIGYLEKDLKSAEEAAKGASDGASAAAVDALEKEVKVAKTDAMKAREKAKLAEEKAKVAEDKAKLAEEKVKLAEEKADMALDMLYDGVIASYFDVDKHGNPVLNCKNMPKRVTKRMGMSHSKYVQNFMSLIPPSVAANMTHLDFSCFPSNDHIAFQVAAVLKHLPGL